MKKILIVLSFLLLTGCFEDSGYITKSCTKNDSANTLNTSITYTFKFKNDIIENLEIVYDYKDSDKVTINSIRMSEETQNKYLNLNYEVLSNNDSEYKIKYNVDLNSNNFSDKFIVNKSRTKLVNKLKDEGYNCE